LVAHRRDLHFGHYQPQVLHGAHPASAAVADKARRLVVPLAVDKVDRILQAPQMPWLYSGVTNT
jgi:hypothetical protein